MLTKKYTLLMIVLMNDPSDKADKMFTKSRNQ